MRSLLLAAGLTMLAGCGAESAGGGSVSSQAIGKGMTPGEYEVDMTGSIRVIGPNLDGREGVSYKPSHYRSSRVRNDGSGGRETVGATNATGPYELRMPLMVQREDEDEPVTATVVIQLPPDARAGQTYPLATSRTARHGEAFLNLSVYPNGLMNMTSGAGTVSVAELDEVLSLQFDFPRNEETRYSGRAYRIPFTPRGEAQVELTIDGQRQEVVTSAAFRNDTSFRMSWSDEEGEQYHLTVGFPGDAPQPGTHSLTGRPGQGQVSMGVSGYPGSLDTNGTLTIDNDGDTWSGTFEFESQGPANITGRGSFAHVGMRDGHR